MNEPLSICPGTGGEHVWTDEVAPALERVRRRERWHCMECGEPMMLERLH